MLSYVLPTRNRPERLLQTLHALDELDRAAHDRIGGAEVVVVDNNSDSLPDVDPALASRLRLRIVRLGENLGAAARNIGIQNAGGAWIVMLDDDSHPLDCDHVGVLLSAPPDVAAIGADIFLPDGSRERGGLPEVIIGCGAAIRRDAFLAVGGYDATFGYYAEEYDLCAKFIFHGWRIAQNQDFRVLHQKVENGRDFNVIVHRLVRNNAWVMQRYAPDDARVDEIGRIIERYAAIAVKERAARGFAEGMCELGETLARQPRTPMSRELWDRFRGATAARCSLSAALPGRRLAIVEEGKNVEVIREVIHELQAVVVNDPAAAEALVIGTLSPGPMRDAWQRFGGRATMCA